ncbi:bifunctional phosphoribosyl-AMP cyclohydrolase/phosphoribosyl-ATP diphosphatase HisIE [Cohnella thailandensis]|uniref:Histidine biosynthesis bifunctional protein HisIE n=1 Tax=Cohnella thailandensis TaxID=557557 RepID=A0A841T5H9_9BACL|nr:bifunctional phosphoribosyl-AMP cyclohydrolase/phosphoribosyl-ATP diphosphatase HisIE [Cohnella thailandensis]MBB6637558.1 bifunctional phosphoribosyl-AMP cyclohydrolase/phosphoribosyl-ATP diphosphatase HisIE [Cohnella thailandensis]MBP1974266.1 phosphoribosyl-ATP pyrophosphohydrolase/phosphoribosyl-AMP cyclohydrolase [Cohnella thailandensis]
MTTSNLIDQIKWSADGLVPAVVQDAVSKEVLMLAYMNQESLKLSLDSGETWFWSRSRGELWNKGATSGNTQKIVSLRYDCDGDTLLVQVVPNGPACHTGAYTCFYRDADGELPEDKRPAADRFATLSALEETIAKRDAERPEGSYTTYLFEKGLDKILKKIGEETAEVIIGGKNEDRQEIRSEAADLIFHLMVLLRQQRIPFDEVLAELEFRHRKPTKKN